MSDGADRTEGLEGRLAKWLNEQGYPLEFETAAAFRSAGFDVHQGYYVEGDDGGLREVDVLAQASVRHGSSLLRAAFVVECKWSADKPWVVFVGGRGMAQSACIAQTIATKAGRTILWARNGTEDLQRLSVFSTPDAPGFGGRQAFSDKRDVFYEAVQGITAAANAIANEWDRRATEPAEHLKAILVAFPVVVIMGRLFEASYDFTGKVRIEEKPASRIHWRGSPKWRLHATVDIVTRDYLGEFVRQRQADMTPLLKVATDTLEELRSCIEAGTLDCLTLKTSSSGLAGRPALLRDLQQQFTEGGRKGGSEAV